jgi:hypothetical protein
MKLNSVYYSYFIGFLNNISILEIKFFDRKNKYPSRLDNINCKIFIEITREVLKIKMANNYPGLGGQKLKKNEEL